MIIPIILAGGAGSRLWPLSREHYPKQLLTLAGENSLLQETLKRIQELAHVQDAIVICNRQYRFLIAEQMLEMGIENPKLILEPAGRNTAPAIAMAAFIAKQLAPHEDPLLLILPADHLIQEKALFCDAIEQALTLAKHHLITFGIQPNFSETGYGYIKLGSPVQNKISKVAEFIEKPPKDKAETYLAAGNYYWNSGMFLFSAATYLTELQTHRPDIFEACHREYEKIHHADGFFVLSETFANCPSESIDYAVMEKTDKALILPLQISWSDIGSWAALHGVLPQDSNNNILQGDVTCIDTKNCLIRAEHRLVATVGLQDHVVIETKDAVMVAHKDYAQKVKDIVAELKISKRIEAEHHPIVNRLWGSYEVLMESPHFKIKLVQIKPQSELHMQKHHHRSEHWIIIEGQATVIINGVMKHLKKSESTYISPGKAHQLKNPSHDIILEILEVQVGDVLLEEDTETLD